MSNAIHGIFLKPCSLFNTMNSKYLIPAILLATTLYACKDDKEKDYLDYLAALNNPAVISPDSTSQDTLSVNPVRLNELDGNAKFIELYNTDAQPFDITGYTLRKDETKVVYVAPQGTVIPPKGYLSLPGNALDYSAGFTSGLSADKACKVELFDPEGKLLDTFCNPPLDSAGTWQDSATYNAKTAKQSFSRYPDGFGQWYMSESTPGTANMQGEIKILW